MSDKKKKKDEEKDKAPPPLTVHVSDGVAGKDKPGGA